MPEPLDGVEIYGGLDLSARADLTALVLIGKQGDTWHIWPYFWTPEKELLERSKRDRQPYDVWVKQGFLRTTPGASVDYEVVARDIAEITAGLNIKAIAFDRWRMDVLKKELADIDFELPLVDHGQGFKDMSPALDAVEAEFPERARLSRHAPGFDHVRGGCGRQQRPGREPQTRQIEGHRPN